MDFALVEGIEPQLQSRSAGFCELCRAAHVAVTARVQNAGEVALCASCAARLKGGAPFQPADWRGVQDGIWSEVSPVKLLAAAILEVLRPDSWAADLADQVWLEDSERAVVAAVVRHLQAHAVDGEVSSGGAVAVKDSNGAVLNEGDSVTLIKDLEVKGAGFTAKRGTLVKGISLTGDPKFVEGKVNGMRIVLVAAFLKKVVS